MKGKAWKFGDSISTDLIAAGRYAHLRSNLLELAKHTLEDAREDFARKVKHEDFVVGGRNFGLGSSREHAPTVIKLCGVQAIIAKSFARIFYRNCINIGLPVVVVDTNKIKEGDVLELFLEKGILKNHTSGAEFKFPPLPRAMQNILDDGGLVPHIIQHGDFKLD